MGDIQIFSNPEFGDIRTLEVNGEPMFVGIDVAKALGYTNPQKAIRDHVDEDDRTIRSVTDTLGREQETSAISESGLYALIMSSKLEGAKKFKKWVTSEVLPAIRKDGGYMIAKDTESDEDLMARALIVAQNAIKRKEERIKQLEDASREQKEVIEAQKPKVTFANAIIGSRNSILIGELAKLISQNGIKVGQNRLFEWLRNNGYLGKEYSYRNIPNQKYVEQGLFEIKKGTRSGNDGVLIETTTTKVTGKGQEYFVNGFLSGRFIL